MSTVEPLQVESSTAVKDTKITSGNQESKTDSKAKREAVPRKRAISGKITQVLFNLGFVFALILAAVCLFFSAQYLYNFLSSTNSGINAVIQDAKTNTDPGALEVIINGRLVMARIALLSCGIFVGISFGFLGFALFLMGIKESIDVDFDSDTYKAKFARMSPGVLVIICSSILTGYCATRPTPFWYDNSTTSTVNQQEDKDSTETNQEEKQEGRDLPRRSKDFSKP